MLKWLIGNHVKKEIKDHLHNLHLHLANSFSNIKEDISKIHIHLQNKDKKLEELENKIHQLENKLFYVISSRKEEPRQLEEPEEDYEEQKEIKTELYDLTNLTFTQQTLIVTIYRLQSQLGSPISF